LAFITSPPVSTKRCRLRPFTFLAPSYPRTPLFLRSSPTGLSMFVVMGATAIVVYEKLGVMILKRTWFNVDLLWAGALVGAGLITLFV
jgi:hypothetical protein